MKAFLSHSSGDKELVQKVADMLGRQHCIYDSFSFNTGNDFRDSINNGLTASGLFVLFFSENAKNSIWVDFEQNEAEYLYF